MMVAMNSPETRPSLLLRICDPGDSQAWSEFARLYQPILIRVARSRGLQDSDAHEIAQDVLITVMKSIARFEIGVRAGGFRRWLATITSNKIRDLQRRQVSQNATRQLQGSEIHHAAEESIVSIDESLDRHWQHQLFYLATECVRPSVNTETWSAFWRTMVDQVPMEEVARELNWSIGNVYVARSRIIAKLRRWVQQQSRLGMENMP